MNTIKILAAFLALAALGRAESTASTCRVIELPPVVVEAARIPALALDPRPSLDELRTEASQSLRNDMRRSLGRVSRRLAANQRRNPVTVDVPVTGPNS